MMRGQSSGKASRSLLVAIGCVAMAIWLGWLRRVVPAGERPGNASGLPDPVRSTPRIPGSGIPSRTMCPAEYPASANLGGRGAKGEKSGEVVDTQGVRAGSVALLDQLRLSPAGSSRNQGVLIAGFADGSVEKHGPLAVGDVLLKINDIPVTSLQSVRAAMRALDRTKGGTLEIERQGKPLKVVLLGR